ncbi:MAG: ABC transporter permease [Chloroflexi bacterium]|nr:ABC transporter permease [Chloroflexota bacterium]
MRDYVIQRVLAIFPVLAVVAVLTFSLIHVVPGDPATILGGDNATEADIERIRHNMGLDKPLYQQFAVWLGNLLQGDLGISPASKYPVGKQIRQRLAPTLSIGIYALVVQVAVALPLGIVSAWKANTWIDRSSMIFAVLAFSIPVFWLEYNMIYTFAVKLSWFPALGYEPLSAGFGPWFMSITMPGVAVGLISAGLVARVTRSTMLEILKEDYVRTARSKGLTERVVLMRHALKNASVPIMTILGLSLAGMIGGLVISEQVFAIPGMGRLIVDAVSNRDFPVIQGVLLIIAVSYVIVNLIIDLSYMYFDPRIRY